MIGKDFKIGVGKESARGTAVTPNAWIPATETPFVTDKKEYIKDEAGYGIIAASADAVIAKEWSEGEISGNVQDQSLGYFLLAAMGQVSSAVKETTAYNHTFSLLNTNAHPSLTLELKSSAEQLKFALCMLKSLKISGEVGKFVTFSASFSGKKGVSSANSVTYADEREFFSKMLTFKHATNLAGLGGASAVKIVSFELSIEKDTEEMFVLGSTEPDDIANKTFSINGNIEAFFADATLEAIYTGGTAKALRIQATHTDTIGASSNPQITIDLAKCHFEEWSPSGGLGDVVKQTIKFDAKYSLADSSIGTVVLTNTKTSY